MRRAGIHLAMRALVVPLGLAALALGCAPSDELTILAADPARDGAPGRAGPFGVALATRDLGSDVGSVSVDVYRPFLDDAAVAAAPAFVLLQGGFIPAERYGWIARHVASRGSVVLAPHHAFDLAFFSQDAAAKALAGARAASAADGDPLFGLVDAGPALIAGHSLGGVVAAKAWLANDDVSDLVLLASEPDGGDDFSGRVGRVLSIVGSVDAKETVAKAVAGARAFDDATVIVVDGMNHYQLTDDPSEGELASDGAPTVDTADAQTLVLTFVDALLDDRAGRAAYPLDDPASWPAGTAAP